MGKVYGGGGSVRKRVAPLPQRTKLIAISDECKEGCQREALAVEVLALRARIAEAVKLLDRYARQHAYGDAVLFAKAALLGKEVGE
jgi:hypothetical protein